MSTTVPLRYNDPSFPQRTGHEGSDVLGASGTEVRPALGVRGGRRKTTRHPKRRNRQRSRRRSHRSKGGFIPSVMEPFVTSVSKYIVPLVLYSGYKLMTRGKKGKKTGRK